MMPKFTSCYGQLHPIIDDMNISTKIIHTSTLVTSTYLIHSSFHSLSIYKLDPKKKLYLHGISNP